MSRPTTKGKNGTIGTRDPAAAKRQDWDALDLPKHKRLQLLLEEKIRDGTYRSGDQLPTEIELMAAHDLSHATVSRAVRQLAKSGLVIRTRKRGTFVTSPPYHFTSPLVPTHASNALALFHALHGIPSTFHPFFTMLFNGFAQAAGAHGMAAKVLETPEEGLGLDGHFLARHGIVGGALMTARKDEIEAALRFKIPVVFLSAMWRDVAADRVLVDVDGAVRQVMAHFRAAGHRRIAVIDTRPHSEHIAEVIAESFGCLPDQAPVDCIYTRNWTEKGAADALAAWQVLPERPTAAYFGDDFLLLNFLRVASRAGIEAPRDLAVVGYGTKFSPELLGSTVSLVEYDPVALAESIVTLLLEQIRDQRPPGKVVRIDTRLVVRSSG